MTKGKFEASDDIGQQLYDMTMDSWQQEEFGSSTEGIGWFGLILGTGIKEAEHVIVTEDTQGFFEYEEFDTREEAIKRFETYRKLYDFVEEDDEE